MSQCIASVAVVGAGDCIGSAVVRGSHATANTWLPTGEKGASRRLWSQRSRLPVALAALWLNLASKTRLPIQCAYLDEAASLEVAVFIIRVAVKFSLPKTTDQLLRNVWKLACYAGFLTEREASRRMLPRARGSIFFTGVTATAMVTRLSPAPNSDFELLLKASHGSSAREASTLRVW
jgi:hypothetical protein